MTFIISGLSLAIYMKVNQVMLKEMSDAVSVGNYAVTVKLSELWYFIPMTIASSVFPSIISSREHSKEKYYNRLQYFYDIMVAMAFLIAIPMTFLSEIIIELLFGTEYKLAGAIVSIHMWSGIFVFLGVARGKWIITENFQFYGMIFTITGAVVNVVLNLLFIPEYGGIGAALAIVVSQALSAWLLAGLFEKTRSAFKQHSVSFLHIYICLSNNKFSKNDY